MRTKLETYEANGLTYLRFIKIKKGEDMRALEISFVPHMDSQEVAYILEQLAFEIREMEAGRR